jgi:acetyl esterase/lipase
VAILAKQRGDVTFVHQSLYYPVTDAAQDTDSYREFADGPFLTARAMAWYWDAYLPEQDRRAEITASPLRASLDDLAGLPEALVIVDENDVLRDEGEAYARRLTEAGVRTASVRYNGTIHEFMLLNPLRGTVRGHRRHRAGDSRAPPGIRNAVIRRAEEDLLPTHPSYSAVAIIRPATSATAGSAPVPVPGSSTRQELADRLPCHRKPRRTTPAGSVHCGHSGCQAAGRLGSASARNTSSISQHATEGRM